MDQSSDNSKTAAGSAAGSAAAPESGSPDISSDSESVPSSPPTRTISTIQGAHSNSWALEYPPCNLKCAVECIGIFPPGEENAENLNLKCSLYKSSDSEPAAKPRPLPMTPVVHEKGNKVGLGKIKAGRAFDDLPENMVGLVQSESITREAERDGAAANPTDAKSEALLNSLSFLFPRLAKKRSIRSREIDQQEYNWVDEAVRHHGAEAAARMETNLNEDELITINDQPSTDLAEVEIPKPRKKKKNKISSKKRKRLRARKTSLEGSLTAAENESEHDTSRTTTNATAKHTSWVGASISAEQEHGISPSAADDKAKKATSTSVPTSTKHGHQQDAFQYTADEKAKGTSMGVASASNEQDTPKNTSDETSEIYNEEGSQDRKQSKKTLSFGAPTLPAYDLDENTAGEQSKLHRNDDLKNADSSAEDDTFQYSIEDTANEICEIHLDERLPDEQIAIPDSMTDTAIRTVVYSEKSKNKMGAPNPHMATHNGGAADCFTEQEITNISEFMNFSKSKIELHDRLFTEMEELIQYLVRELRILPDLQGKYCKVIEDLRTVFTRLHDLDARARMTAHNIEHSQAGGANVNDMDILRAEMEETGQEINPSMKKDINRLVSSCGGSVELQKVASRVAKCQRELDEVVKRLDADIAKYIEINSQLKGSIKAVKNDIFGLQRTSKATKSELAEVSKTATDLDENIRAIGDTLNVIVQAAHNVPTTQQASAEYEHAMKEIENVSAQCNRLKKTVEYNSDTLKKGNDEILASLDKHVKLFDKHSEKLDNCHETLIKTRDAVKGHDGFLNTLNNKANAHQKLIAKVTAQSDSNSRRLHTLSDTTARDIKALSESTSSEIKSLTESISCYIQETCDQLKKTHVQLEMVKTNIDSQAQAITCENFLHEQKVKDIVMTLLNPIASEVDKLSVKVESYLGLLDHVSPARDRPPKPRELSFAQKHPKTNALAAARATVEAQYTNTQPTEVSRDGVNGGGSGASQAAGSDIKVPKVRIPGIERIRSESMSETPVVASPAPIEPHPSPPGYTSDSVHASPVMQILKPSELRRSSPGRNERHPQDGPLPKRVVAERRNRMQRQNSRVFGNGVEGPNMVMDRAMMAPQNAYGEGHRKLAVAQQHQITNTQPQIVVAPHGIESQQMFGGEYVQKQFDQRHYEHQHYDRQDHDQFDHEICYPVSQPLAIIPVDENIPPAPYIPQEDPRDNHIMLLTYNVDNLNARINEATNAMSVAQSSIRNFRAQYRYEISQEVEREVERAMGREVVRMEARINQNLCRRMNNTERRVSDRTSRESKKLGELLPVLEELLRREGMEVQPQTVSKE